MILGTFGENDCSATRLVKYYEYEINLGIVSMYHLYVKHIQSPRRNCLTLFSFNENEQCKMADVKKIPKLVETKMWREKGVKSTKNDLYKTLVRANKIHSKYA